MRYAKDGDDDFRDFLSSSAAAGALVQCCLIGCATVILRCLQQFKIAYFLGQQSSAYYRRESISQSPQVDPILGNG